MFLDKLRNKSATQLLTYATIGVVTNLIGYTLYLLLTFIGSSPKLTMTFLYGIGATINFYANKRLTFSHKGGTLGAGFRYVIAYFAGYFLNFFILIVMVDKLHYPHQIVQGAAILIVAIFLFLSCKYYVFYETSAKLR